MLVIQNLKGVLTGGFISRFSFSIKSQHSTLNNLQTDLTKLNPTELCRGFQRTSQWLSRRELHFLSPGRTTLVAVPDRTPVLWSRTELLARGPGENSVFPFTNCSPASTQKLSLSLWTDRLNLSSQQNDYLEYFTFFDYYLQMYSTFGSIDGLYITRT